MKKGNKIRIIIWGLLGFIALVCASLGIISYHNGYGVIGKIIYKTKPIVKTFNKLNSLEKYINAGMTINAKVEDTTITVNYNSVATTTSFIFTYEDISGVDVLKISYNKSEEQTAGLVTQFMIESVSINKGHVEGAVFNKYTLDDFLQTSINDGVSITDNNSIRTVYINMNKAILDSDVVIKTEEEKIEEAKNMFLENTKTIFKAVQNENQNENARYYSKNAKACTVSGSEANTLNIEGMENTDYYIEIKKNEITNFFVSDLSLALTFTKSDKGSKITLEDIGTTLMPISKNEDEISYNLVVSQITNECK